MQKIRLIIFLSVLFMAGCQPNQVLDTASGGTAATAVQVGATRIALPIVNQGGAAVNATALESLTPAPAPPDFKNATYMIEGTAIALVDGASEIEAAPGSATKVITHYFGNEAFGDLNGDGWEDAAFIVTQNTGGSGTFFYIAAALQSESGAVGLNAVLLGDRIVPQSTSIEGGMLTVHFADRKADESFVATPSVDVSKQLKVTDGALVEVK